MPTGIFHRNKTPTTRPDRPMSVPAISTISDNRLSYAQAGRQGGRDNVGPTPKELMSFSSLLKGSARRPTGKEKSKPGKGSFGAPSLIAPHSTPYSPPGRSSTLPRSMPSSSAVDAKPSIAGLVRTSLGIDRGCLSLSPSAKDHNKRGLDTPTMGRPLPKYRNPLDLLRSPNKGKTSLAKNFYQDVPASQNDGSEVRMKIKIVNKPKPDKSFTPF